MPTLVIKFIFRLRGFRGTDTGFSWRFKGLETTVQLVSLVKQVTMCFFVSAGLVGPDHWAPQPQVSSSLESSTSSQEHLNFSASSSSSNKTQNQKTGPGRWKTPNAPHTVPPHSAQPPSRSDLPPPPPPPPGAYPEPYDPQPDLPLPPPPAAINPVTAQQAADRKKREEQQRWYEKEKARLEEERWACFVYWNVSKKSIFVIYYLLYPACYLLFLREDVDKHLCLLHFKTLAKSPF